MRIDDNTFFNKYISHLNANQQKAVQTVDGPILLLAVPGSGKTTVLVNRLGYMVFCKGINPNNILTLTYTVAATNDMSRRFASIFGEEYSNLLEFRTINSICLKTGSPNLDPITDGLRENRISYIVVEDGDIIEKKEY